MRRYRPHLVVLAIAGAVVAAGSIADRVLYTDVMILGPMAATFAIPSAILLLAIIEVRHRRGR